MTAVDDGTMPGEWGSMCFDDEGHPAQRNVLIENGVLKSYLVDILGSRLMNHRHRQRQATGLYICTHFPHDQHFLRRRQ